MKSMTQDCIVRSGRLIWRAAISCFFGLFLSTLWKDASHAKEEFSTKIEISRIFIPFAERILFLSIYPDDRASGSCNLDGNKFKLLYRIDKYILKNSPLSESFIGLNLSDPDVVQRLFQQDYFVFTCDIISIDDVDVSRSPRYLIDGSFSIGSFSGSAAWFLSCDQFYLLISQFEKLLKDRFTERESDSDSVRSYKMTLSKLFPKENQIVVNRQCEPTKKRFSVSMDGRG